MIFIGGGKLGDFLHSLWVIRNTPGKHTLYITDKKEYGGDFFSKGLTKTYEDLEPILSNQNFIEKFSILEKPIDEYINLNNWRNSKLLFNDCWTNILKDSYSVFDYEKGSWLNFDNIDLNFNNKVVIHCSLIKERNNPSFPWSDIIKSNDCIFVSSDENEYKNFNMNLPFYHVKSLSEHFEIINSCKIFVGNQSSPFVIAHSLDKRRLLNVSPTIDGKHYIGEENYHNNFSWMFSHKNFSKNFESFF